MSAQTEAIARAIDEIAGLVLLNREDETGIVVSGMMGTEESRGRTGQTARGIWHDRWLEIR